MAGWDLQVCGERVGARLWEVDQWLTDPYLPTCQAAAHLPVEQVEGQEADQ